MSTGLHPARESLHIPNLGNPPPQALYPPTDAASNAHMNGMLPKPMSLSPRTFGMDDFCTSMGFKTGLTPRVFSTGLTPRSGFTPRFTTGFTPRIGSATGIPGLSDTNAFFNNRNTGFSPRNGDGLKMPSSGFTPKDMKSSMQLRFSTPFGVTPNNKMGEQMSMHSMQQQQSQQQQQQQQQQDLSMSMSMFDYMNRPTIPQQQQQQQQPELMLSTKSLSHSQSHGSISPSSSDHANEPEDLDERRRMKNRERVRKCRKRKQDRLNFLEERTSDLEKENGQLRLKLARNDVSMKNRTPRTDAQLNEMRKQQNTTLAAYVHAFNSEVSGSAIEESIRAVWADTAEIFYGHSRTSVAGIASIIANKMAVSSTVFEQYKICNYSVEWKATSVDKCIVTWELQLRVKPNAPNDVAMTAPLVDLSRVITGDRVWNVQMVSHLTFDNGKIVEELRQPNVTLLADTVLAEGAQDPTVVADVLRCLVKA